MKHLCDQDNTPLPSLFQVLICYAQDHAASNIISVWSTGISWPNSCSQQCHSCFKYWHIMTKTMQPAISSLFQVLAYHDQMHAASNVIPVSSTGILWPRPCSQLYHLCLKHCSDRDQPGYHLRVKHWFHRGQPERSSPFQALIWSKLASNIIWVSCTDLIKTSLNVIWVSSIDMTRISQQSHLCLKH